MNLTAQLLIFSAKNEFVIWIILSRSLRASFGRWKVLFAYCNRRAEWARAQKESLLHHHHSVNIKNSNRRLCFRLLNDVWRFFMPLFSFNIYKISGWIRFGEKPFTPNKAIQFQRWLTWAIITIDRKCIDHYRMVPVLTANLCQSEWVLIWIMTAMRQWKSRYINCFVHLALIQC